MKGTRFFFIMAISTSFCLVLLQCPSNTQEGEDQDHIEVSKGVTINPVKKDQELIFDRPLTGDRLAHPLKESNFNTGSIDGNFGKIRDADGNPVPLNMTEKEWKQQLKIIGPPRWDQ